MKLIEGGKAERNAYLVMVQRGMTAQQACEQDANKHHPNLWVAYRRAKGGCEFIARADREIQLRQKTIGQLKAKLIIVAPHSVRLAASQNQPPPAA